MPHSEQSVSFWATAHPPVLTRVLSRHTETDVCVIGAGIAGLTTAYLLAREGKRVLVLEKDAVGAGETSRTTAHVVNALDDRYSVLEKIHGRAKTKLACESHTHAIRLVETIARQEGIECDLKRVPGYLVPGSSHDEVDLKHELGAARRAGVDLDWVDATQLSSELQGFGGHGCFGPALKFHGQLQFHPLKYLQGLLKAIERLGGLVFTQSRATDLAGSKTVNVYTELGCTVRARSVVVATNTPFVDRLVMHTKQAAYRSYVIALRLRNPAPFPFLLWDTDDPYHYVRTAPAENGEDHYLIVGGEDHKTGQDSHPGDRWSKLEAWTRKRFPKAREVTHRWSGQIIEPVDGLGFAGLNPPVMVGPLGTKNRYIITGDSGNGMTHGTLGAHLVADLVLHRQNAWEDVYTPNRRKWKGLPDFVRENLNTALQYRDWLKDGDSVQIEDLKFGQSAIIRSNFRKQAVYRDHHGDLHICAAKCPHLGAIVRWNEAEKTWDCPAHGSRFDCDGKVLNGPASSDLKSGSSTVSGENPQPIWPET